MIKVNMTELGKIIPSSSLDYFQLVDLNDKFFFVSGQRGYSSDSSVLFILNRNDSNNLFKYFKAEANHWFLYNHEVIARSFKWVFYVFSIYDGDSKKKFVDASSVVKIKKNDDDEFENLFLISNYKYMYSKPYSNRDCSIIKYKMF
jgi:hypothetical protein